MGYDAKTVETYDKSAEEMAAHFTNYVDGVSNKDIDKTFELAGNPIDARVVEIGCGAGKDAKYLFEKSGWYAGFDPSEKLLAMAREHVPGANLTKDDAVHYEYPRALDMVFAMASLLHVDREDFGVVMDKLAAAVRPGGLVCLTLKEADEYGELRQADDFGERLFYLYNPEIVRELAGEKFEQVYEEHQLSGPKKKRWFTIILRRKA